jgi:hydrogenase maturation protease
LNTLVLGMGNTILTDDGVGIHVMRGAAERFQQKGVVFTQASVGGLRLLDFIGGYDRLIIVDAIQTRGGTPGTIHSLHPSDLQASLHAGSSHDLSLQGVLALGREIGLALPSKEALTIIAIEAEDVMTFGEACTPAVAAAIPGAVDMVLAELDSLRPT